MADRVTPGRPIPAGPLRALAAGEEARARLRAPGIAHTGANPTMRLRGGRKLLVKLSGSSSPYGAVEHYDTGGGGKAPLPDGLECSGCVREVNAIAGLGGRFARVTPAEDGLFDLEWKWRPNPCAPTSICCRVWSTASCSWLSGVPVAIAHAYTTIPGGQLVTEPIGSQMTDGVGQVCTSMVPKLSDPTVAPTVDRVGGGATGGGLPIGTYRALFTRANPYGETLPSPPSAEWQVGVPDPTAYPPMAGPVAGPNGAETGGQLARGTYSAAYVLRDAAGGATRPSTIGGFRVGCVSPVVSATFVTATSTFPAARWRIVVTALDGAGETEAGQGALITLPSPPSSYRLSLAWDPATNATGYRVYLAPDDGSSPRLTWSGTTTSATIAGPPDPAAAIAPAANTTGGQVPRLILPSLPDLRPGATACDLYLSAGGAYRRYATGIAAGPVDCPDPFPTSGPGLPGTNTTARGIPALTVPIAGAFRVYVAAIASTGGTPDYRLYAPLTTTRPPIQLAIPYPLAIARAANQPAPPTRNSTADGAYVFTATVDGCGSGSTSATVSGDCQALTCYLSFCCWTMSFVYSAAGGGGPTGPTDPGPTNPTPTDPTTGTGPGGSTTPAQGTT